MKPPTSPTLLVAAFAALCAGTSTADDPADPAPLNYKIEVRCKFGDASEQVFRLSDAEGEFATESPMPPMSFEGKLERREGKAFVLTYSCAWRQDIVEAPRDPANPKVPKGRGSYREGSVKGKARIAKGRPVDVYDGERSKVTITLLEIREVPDFDLGRVQIRPAKKVAAGE